MPRPAVIEKIAGTTFRGSFVSSLAVPSLISSTLLDNNETVVNTFAPIAVSSGSGSFFATHYIPKSPAPAWYVNEWIAVIQANTYVDRQFIRARSMET